LDEVDGQKQRVVSETGCSTLKGPISYS